MRSRLTAPLREAPVTVPALAAVALFVVWATDQAGFPVTHWAPGGLIVLVLLGVAAFVVGPRAGDVPLSVKVALGCLAGYTALSFLSILWAAVPGDAWDGANRTLLYLLVFALFAGWRQRGRSAALLLCVWTLAIVGLAAFVLAHVTGASASSVRNLLPEGRLVFPSGYANANAALWLMAFWPALLMAAGRGLHWVLRGLLAGGAVMLAEVALLSQSRGSIYATPVMLVLVFGLTPARLRTFAIGVPVAIGVAAAAPAVLRVGNKLSRGGVEPARLHAASTAIVVTSVAVAVVVALGAMIESRVLLGEPTARLVRRGVGALAITTLVVLVAGGLVAAGDPITRIKHGWDTFKSENGYAANGAGDRLVSGLGSSRYDFYRVALDEFVAHPLLGIGADNFQEPYLEHGRSAETPHYPHSVELRTLAETGLAGTLLALIGLGAALVGVARAVRPPRELVRDPLGVTVATAAISGFGYWAVHGSFDWFWEFAGLGAPAFALLGLACSLVPARREEPREVGASGVSTPVASAPTVSERQDAPGGRWPRRQRARGRNAPLGATSRPSSARRALIAAAALVLTLVAVVSLAAPWLGQLEVQDAARIWPRAPRRAYARLDDAARLSALSDEPYLVAGSIALRFGELAHADKQFSMALKRTPGDAYALLERGAIASTSGRREQALSLLERAARLNPRDPLTKQALQLVRAHRRVSVVELNREILSKGQSFA